MIAEEIVQSIAAAGGVLTLKGDRVKYRLPAPVAHLADELREHKPEVVSLLRSVGGRVGYFPACPNCGAYCLHREQTGFYECLRPGCGLKEIEEHDARIASFLKEARSPVGVM